MAKYFYAYLPAFMKLYMYEGVSEDFISWDEIVIPFLRGTSSQEKIVIMDEIDRLLCEESTEERLLEKVWSLGARDFPGNLLRNSFLEIRDIVQKECHGALNCGDDEAGQAGEETANSGDTIQN